MWNWVPAVGCLSVKRPSAAVRVEARVWPFASRSSTGKLVRTAPSGDTSVPVTARPVAAFAWGTRLGARMSARAMSVAITTWAARGSGVDRSICSIWPVWATRPHGARPSPAPTPRRCVAGPGRVRAQGAARPWLLRGGSESPADPDVDRAEVDGLAVDCPRLGRHRLEVVRVLPGFGDLPAEVLGPRLPEHHVVRLGLETGDPRLS